MWLYLHIQHARPTVGYAGPKRSANRNANDASWPSKRQKKLSEFAGSSLPKRKRPTCSQRWDKSARTSGVKGYQKM